MSGLSFELLADAPKKLEASPLGSLDRGVEVSAVRELDPAAIGRWLSGELARFQGSSDETARKAVIGYVAELLHPCNVAVAEAAPFIPHLFAATQGGASSHAEHARRALFELAKVASARHKKAKGNHAPLAALRAAFRALLPELRKDAAGRKLSRALPALALLGLIDDEQGASSTVAEVVSTGEGAVRATALLAMGLLILPTALAERRDELEALLADGDALVASAAAVLLHGLDEVTDLSDATRSRIDQEAAPPRLAALRVAMQDGGVPAAGLPPEFLLPLTDDSPGLERARVVFAGPKLILLEHPSRGRLKLDVADTGLSRGSEVELGFSGQESRPQLLRYHLNGRAVTVKLR